MHMRLTQRAVYAYFFIMQLIKVRFFQKSGNNNN